MSVEKLSYYCNGTYRQSETDRYYDLYNPSTGEITGQAPCCTNSEVEEAIAAAKAAYPAWSATPAIKRAQVLYNMRSLIEEHLDELTELVAREHGKVWDEALGDVLKAKEGTELATQVPTQMMGESLMDTSAGFDTVLYRESIGVFAGIVPFNFPAMIPMGWMAPVCIASGNTMVLKVSSTTPRTALRMAALYKEAGLPDGVLNLVTCSRNEVDTILNHPDVKGITFVGSTDVGKSIYSKAAASGKRVQCLCEAKNHALVLEDAPIDRTAAGIINAAFGCAGERCMALPVAVVQESIADELVEALAATRIEDLLGQWES
ncbi:MAG: aldehyde dehydrogenase family protein, partial [Clostridiales bacterium]|nr:aldehyde dehydrogenase family protein [Clostridiales bacterium]